MNTNPLVLGWQWLADDSFMTFSITYASTSPESLPQLTIPASNLEVSFIDMRRQSRLSIV
jgi:hypothetical protein